MLAITTDSDVLVVTCDKCQNVGLVDPASGKTVKGFVGDGSFSSRLCFSSSGRFWAYSGDGLVREFKFDGTQVTRTKKSFSVGITGCYGVCDIPEPHKTMIVSHGQDRVVKAVSYATGQNLWTMKGEMAGKRIDPWGVVFSQEHHTVIVADWCNNRLLVTKPQDGTLLQSILLPADVGSPRQLLIHENQLIIRSYHRGQDRHKISYFAFQGLNPTTSTTDAPEKTE